MWSDGPTDWMGFGLLFFILFWVAVMWVIVWVVKKVTAKDDAGTRNALDIAKERYARGEITKGSSKLRRT